MKPKKSPPARVWNHKIILRHRTRPPFIFLDRYDPKQAYKYLFWVLVVTRKLFLRVPNAHFVLAQTHVLGYLRANLPLKEHET